MADDEGDAQERRAELVRRLAGMPPPMPAEEAVALFLADMEQCEAEYREDDQRGAGAALIAATRLCHALGRDDLTAPFTELTRGLLDLVQGKRAPRIFRARAVAEGNPKSRQEWSICASICSFLDVLMKDTKMERDKAATEVAALLDKHAVKMGGTSTPTWKAVLSVRDDLSRGKCPPEAAEEYRYLANHLRRDLQHVPYAIRRSGLLNALDETLSRRPKNPEQG